MELGEQRSDRAVQRVTPRWVRFVTRKPLREREQPLAFRCVEAPPHRIAITQLDVCGRELQR